jgi:predicted transcriptional regulator
MSTTTIRLPEDLKARITAAAKRAGTSTHGFILEAIAEKAEQEERRADFDAVAEERYSRIVASGKSIPWQEMRGYLEERLAGKKAKRPAARKLAR